MRDIYSGSKNVTVYLGDGRNHRPKKGIPRRSAIPLVEFHNDQRDQAHLQAFWDALSNRGSLASTFHMFSFLRIVGDTQLGKILAEKITDADPDTINDLSEHLRMLLLSPWWQRVWVV